MPSQMPKAQKGRGPMLSGVARLSGMLRRGRCSGQRRSQAQDWLRARHSLSMCQPLCAAAYKDTLLNLHTADRTPISKKRASGTERG